MRYSDLSSILAAASRHVRAWPKWMQQPEYRYRYRVTIVDEPAQEEPPPRRRKRCKGKG